MVRQGKVGKTQIGLACFVLRMLKLEAGVGGGGSESRRQTGTDVWDGLKRGFGSYRARAFDQWRFHGLRSVCVAGSGRVSRLGRKFPMKSIG